MLTPRQRKFVAFYVQGYSGEASAIKAGYSEKSAHSIGCENLSKPIIKEAIREAMVRVLSMIEVSSAEVILNQFLNSTSDIMDFVEVDENGQLSINLLRSPGKTRTIKEIETIELPPLTVVENGVELKREVIKTRVKLHDKNSSAVFMARALGLFKGEQDPSDKSRDDKFEKMSVIEICKRIAFIFAQAEAARKNALDRQSSSGDGQGGTATGGGGSDKPPQS